MIELNLTYKQFCIFNCDLENPFNNWNDVHVQQGFVVRENSISVMTISTEGILCIDILSENILIDKAKRIIEFDFIVMNNCVEIATITDCFQIKVIDGHYKIRVQLYSEYDGKDICYITFLKKQEKEELPKYIKYDSEIKRVKDFDLHGEAAI